MARRFLTSQTHVLAAPSSGQLKKAYWNCNEHFKCALSVCLMKVGRTPYDLEVVDATGNAPAATALNQR